MPESDIGKMKVADLKRELKIRGLSTSGNKNELQERLQNALIDGELSLEDTAISGEDLLEGDTVLSDEEEAKILGADENELLKSPTTTPTAIVELDISTVKETEEVERKTPPSKKIILKRRSSFTVIGSETTVNVVAPSNNANATAITKENTEPSALKFIKTSDHNPITLTNTNQKEKVSKISELSMQERLEMRAKKFGITVNKTNTHNNGTSSVTNDQQMETLKKRAERFGCVVSSKIAKLDAEEKLQKRKQRFGITLKADTGKSVDSNIWEEKARQRLERFKTSVDTAPSVTVNTVVKK